MSMNLPGFLKTNPAPEPNAVDTREQKASEGWGAIQSLIEERNNLRTDFNRLEADYAELHRAYEQQKVNLAHERARADHYERFSTEIVVQFNTLRMVIDDIQKRCVDVAYKRLAPTPRIEEPAMSTDDQARMEELARALAPQTPLPEASS